MAKITFVLEDGQEIQVPLAEHITLGRAEDNDVVVDDDRISKRHAELVRNADGSIQLFDSNSTAGTFVNGERVRSHTIRHGDRLTFGPLTAVLDLEDHVASGHNGTPAPVPAPNDTQSLVSDSPVKAGKIASRKKQRGARRDFVDDKQTALPVEEIVARQQAELRETAAKIEAEKAQLQSELEALQKELCDWQGRSEKERVMHSARVESLRADEERLAPMQEAVQKAEAANGEWIASIQALSTQHEEKSGALEQLKSQHDQKAADLRQLADDESKARHELENLATHREQALAHLQQLRGEQSHDEAVLDTLRHQIAEFEARSIESKEIAEVREDQVKSAEKKIEQLSQRRSQLEAHILELAGTEEKLLQTLEHCREAEAKHAGLSSAIAALVLEQQSATTTVKNLESRVAALREDHQLAAQAADEAKATRQRLEESLQKIQAELALREKDLAARGAELTAETQRLDETRTRRAEIAQQCQELAETEQKLAGVKQQLTAAEQQLAGVKNAVAAEEERVGALKSSIKDLEGVESSAKGRIEVLHSREKDLRIELTQLAASERSERARFEEVRQLATEAEKTLGAQKQQLAASIESSRQDLAELMSKLTPLRDWKEAMDQLYARLATLPQDSPEARDLWHEIEKEKADLLDLIATARTQAHPGGSSEPRFKTVASHPSKTERPRLTRTESTLSPGTAQETTLRARLNHLRENVQREEARLEHLRLERTRHEVPRTSPAAGAMMREHERQLEAKIRRDEEHYTAIQRKLELAETEEEKRRDKVTDLERKLTELRSAITEAERQRSELRQQADLAHTELKNYEATIDRVTKKSSE